MVRAMSPADRYASSSGCAQMPSTFRPSTRGVVIDVSMDVDSDDLDVRPLGDSMETSGR
jgi:hypothetical protein